MKMSRLFLAAAMLISLPGMMFAQGSIEGRVSDVETGEGLAAANVIVVGTSFGAAADLNGNYVIENIPVGTYTVKVSYIGYEVASHEVTVNAGEAATVNFELQPQALVTEGVYVTANRAKERETPAAFSDVKKEIIEANLGSRDIPLVLNTTPSVYATAQGGGAGDARINVRGFNQRNVAVMINGVPVNDMENGWVYWSNWDGVADATSSIQVQRGLSPVNLAVPSIGGTMNILTDPTALEDGGKLKQELGSATFLKSTASYNTGLIGDKFALSGAIVRKTGNGVIDKAWTDAWAYYFGASYNLNENNRLELYALGAPQRHGQNLYKQNIAAYSHEFASSLDDYDPAALDAFPEAEAGRLYNQNWNFVDPSYNGLQAVGDKTFSRYDSGFINERENFYHKPQVNLNWFSRINDKMGLYTVLYYSGGRGGGTGTYGSLVWDYSGPSRIADWNATIERNRANDDGSRGILRNSRNNQWTIGAISKATLDVSESLKMIVGLDWRTAAIEHYREVRDLLGGSYYRDLTRGGTPYNEFVTAEQATVGLGDKVNYNFKNTVDWVGAFAQGEYTSGQITAYGMAGWSTIKYTYNNFFKKGPDGNALFVDSGNIAGLQAKGGASYRLNEDVHVFANAGYVSKVPIFDVVINDRNGVKAANPQNEKFISLEAGINVRGLDGKLSTKFSLYNTTWKDRAKSVGVQNEDGSEGLVFLSGMNLLHQGVEVETAFQPNRMFRLDAAASVGNWKLTDDVSGVYKDYSGSASESVEYTYYVKNLKVGDAPQTQLALMGTVYPVRGLRAQVVYRYYANHYANWDPFSRTNPDDTAQSWQAPNYGVMDLHVNYNLPMNFGRFRPQLFLHVFNALDKIYVQDAVDNSRYNAYKVNRQIVNPHKADAAEVFLGMPRYINAGLKFDF